MTKRKGPNHHLDRRFIAVPELLDYIELADEVSENLTGEPATNHAVDLVKESWKQWDQDERQRMWLSMQKTLIDARAIYRRRSQA